MAVRLEVTLLSTDTDLSDFVTYNNRLFTALYFLLFFSIAEHVDIIMRELDASAKWKF